MSGSGLDGDSSMFGRPQNEIELLQASLGGSTQALGVLVGSHQSLVCAITYSATGSVERKIHLKPCDLRVGRPQTLIVYLDRQ
jgi:hypothetical protein